MKFVDNRKIKSKPNTGALSALQTIIRNICIICLSKMEISLAYARSILSSMFTYNYSDADPRKSLQHNRLQLSLLTAFLIGKAGRKKEKQFHTVYLEKLYVRIVVTRYTLIIYVFRCLFSCKMRTIVVGGIIRRNNCIDMIFLSIVKHQCNF